jgi:acyl-CoA reductase-like NAD-dependent aldehyde dehydrogenase
MKGQSGAEVSPFTRKPLGIDYPVSDPDTLMAAAQAAMAGWRKFAPETRIALCLEMAARLYARNFEMAHSVMHVAGQSYTQAFSGSGPNALDRGIEALAYAAKAMREVLPTARWECWQARAGLASGRILYPDPRPVAYRSLDRDRRRDDR